MAQTSTAKRTKRPTVKAKVGLAKGATGEDVKEVQEYLARFGYFAEPAEKLSMRDDGSVSALDTRPEVAAGKFDAATEEALRNFQKMAGLVESGELDEATKEKMGAPRCGTPDVVSFVTTGGRWPTNNLVYSFDNLSADVTNAECRQAVHQALSTWAGYTPLTFREGTAAQAQLILRFVTGDHGDGFPFDGSGGVLAHAFFPPVPPSSPTAIQGDAHFDEAEVWTIVVPPGANQFDLTTVAIHEFGHSLGLDHSPVVGAVMEAFYGGPRRTLHNDDIGGLTSIYGGYSIAEASWTHGTSIQVEDQGAVDSMRRFGFFTRIVGKAGTTNWFHFAIPTPVIVNDVRKSIGPCLLRFQTGGTAAVVRDVHIYDGEVRVAAHDFVNLSGSQPLARFGVAHAPAVLFGVGISIGVQFGRGTAPQRSMDFISAGCDFRP
jgi:peptidoglycan hydrolase-like protein with peptidoglycan-binding domain